MNPQQKAAQIKDRFGSLSAIYITQFIEDASLESGDYRMQYSHEWTKYFSYWQEVLHSIMFSF